MLPYVMGYRAGYKAATAADGPGGKGYDAAYRTGMQVGLDSASAYLCPGTVVHRRPVRVLLESQVGSMSVRADSVTCASRLCCLDAGGHAVCAEQALLP
jgi:hypothetical protein